MKLKKVLSSVLAAALILSTMSLTAFAAATEIKVSAQQGHVNLPDPGSAAEYVIDVDTTANKLIQNGSSFNGVTATIGGTGALTMTGYNSTPQSIFPSVINTGRVDSPKTAVTNVNYTINSGTYTGSNGYGALTVSPGATVTLNGGTFNGDICVIGKYMGSSSAGESGKLIINEGVVINGNVYILENEYAVDKPERTPAEVTISGGSVTGTIYVDAYDAAYTGEKNALVINSGSSITGAIVDKGDSVVIHDYAAVAGVAITKNAGTADEEEVTYDENGNAVTLADKITDTINVTFEQAKDDNDEDIDGLYNIVLNAEDGKGIYEFVGAELNFSNTSKTVAGENMTYEIYGIENVTDVEQNIDNPTMWAFTIVDEGDRLSDFDNKGITIGQVKFVGYGTIYNFYISEDAYSTVVTTEYNTNLEQYYKGDEGKLTSTWLSDTIAEATGNVMVKVAYNHELKTGVWSDDQITVTLEDAFGVKTDKINIGDGEHIFENVRVGKIAVTLEAPGFRKYTYKTQLEKGVEELELNFWNNVKRGTGEDPLAAIEVGVSKEEAHNFVVGDIVMDKIVDEYDLAAVTSWYGKYNITGDNKYLNYDLNRDGNIDIIDVAYVLHTYDN